jgi:hypothetical protein
MQVDRIRQARQVDENYDAFMRLIGEILPEHRGQLALMRDRQIVAYFDKPGEAYRTAVSRYPDGVFSIQEVTDEPIDLGFWSHVGG